MPDESGVVIGTGNSVCADCGVGHFANVSGLAQCDPCATGSYADETGLITCELCGIG